MFVAPQANTPPSPAPPFHRADQPLPLLRLLAIRHLVRTNTPGRALIHPTAPAPKRGTVIHWPIRAPAEAVRPIRVLTKLLLQTNLRRMGATKHLEPLLANRLPLAANIRIATRPILTITSSLARLPLLRRPRIRRRRPTSPRRPPRTRIGLAAARPRAARFRSPRPGSTRRRPTGSGAAPGSATRRIITTSHAERREQTNPNHRMISSKHSVTSLVDWTLQQNRSPESRRSPLPHLKVTDQWISRFVPDLKVARTSAPV
jgi:hypothetical protein